MLKIGPHIDALIKRALTDALKAAGFKKQARTFRRVEADGSVSIINIQNGKYNEGECGEFTVNLARYVPELADMAAEARLEKPQEQNSHFRQRIGHVMPDKDEDYWWQLDAHSDDAALAAELSEAVLVHGLAWLNTLLLHNFKAAGADLDALPGGQPFGSPLYAAGFYLMAGQPLRARQEVLDMIEHIPRHAEHARAWAQRNGVPLD